MNVIVSGASGLIGSACVGELRGAGHEVQTLNRGSGPGLPWDVESGRVNFMDFSPDAVIHLAGENIATQWTEKKMKSIRASRVDATRELCEFLAGLRDPPKIFLSASAIGF